MILLAQHLLALLHLPEVAQLLHHLVEALIEPRVVAQQAAQLDLLELDHQRYRWIVRLRRPAAVAGIVPLFGLAG